MLKTFLFAQYYSTLSAMLGPTDGRAIGLQTHTLTLIMTLLGGRSRQSDTINLPLI